MSNGLSNFFGAIAAWLCLAPVAFAREPLSMPCTLAPGFTAAHCVANLSLFLIWITGGILLAVGGLLAFEPLRFRAAKSDPSKHGNQFGLDGDSCTGAGAPSRVKRGAGCDTIGTVARPDHGNGGIQYCPVRRKKRHPDLGEDNDLEYPQTRLCNMRRYLDWNWDCSLVRLTHRRIARQMGDSLSAIHACDKRYRTSVSIT
jgi:hypothetical protein